MGGVEITDISVTNVHLPQEFADNMQETTVWHNRNEFKTLQQEYDLRKIEVREAEAKEKQKLKEDLEKFTAEKDKEDADVLEVKSNAELVVAKLHSQRDVRLSQIRSSGVAEADKIKIETESYVQSKRANAEAEIASNNAQSLALTSSAEKFAAVQLKAKRKYEAKMRSLQSMRSLSGNSSLAIAGNSKDNMMAQLLANRQGGAVLGVNSM